MGRDAQERLPLPHVAAHQTEVEQLEVAKPAVDETRGSRAGARGEIVLLDEGDGQSAERGVARDPGSDDPAADDKEIDGAVTE